MSEPPTDQRAPISSAPLTWPQRMNRGAPYLSQNGYGSTSSSSSGGSSSSSTNSGSSSSSTNCSTSSSTTTSTTTTTTTTTGGPRLEDARKKTEGTVDLVVDQDEEATVRWTLGRWRSSKEVLGPGGLEPPSEPPLKDSEGHRKKKLKRSSHHVSIDCLRCASLSAQPRACVLHCIGPSCVYPK